MDKELTATYIGDSRHYHFSHIDGGQGAMGNIYLPKDEPVPRSVRIRLRTKDEAEAEQKRR